MRYSVTIAQELYQSIHKHILSDANMECAGFAFAGISQTQNEVRFLLREFHPIESCQIKHADKNSMRIDSEALAKAMKYADHSHKALVFIHSHPSKCSSFSIADDKNESQMFMAAFSRIKNVSYHASIIFPHDGEPIARVWLQDGQYKNIDRIRVIGTKFLFFDKNRTRSSSECFDRQIRAFGHEIQNLLASLHIAVVGMGGTGSASFEQLVRLGIGKLSIYDCQKLEKSNVSRVFGSCVSDTGKYKVDVLSEWGRKIGLDTEIIPYQNNITEESVAKTLRDADIIFGCTDDYWGRSILNDLAIQYLIPVIDMGVKVEPQSDSKTIQAVYGRVTTLITGAACLFCRKRIFPEKILAESIRAKNPEEAKMLIQEGYIPGLEEHDPSVIMFTSSIASSAICELLHRLTGFMGAERTSTETIHIFDQTQIRTSTCPPISDCKCTKQDVIGIGDTQNFLGLLWK